MNIGPLNISPPVVLAPMAGISSWPMRMLCREFGAPLCFTEMIPAPAIARGRMQADVIYALKAHPGDRPLGYQIFGREPGEMAKAAASLSALEADLIDINMGCPVKKITHAGSGCSLMKDLDLARRIIAEVRARTPVPLTVKMRLGWDEDCRNAVELARICEGEGVDAVTVHGRTRSRGFAGEADLAGIKAVVDAVKIPVIGNGGINSAADARRMLAETGCAGVMVARGARGRPWIFSEIIAALATPCDDNSNADNESGRESGRGSGRGCPHPRKIPHTPPEIAAIVLQHFSWMLDFMSEGKAVREMRIHLNWYSRGLMRASELRRRLPGLAGPEDVRGLVRDFFLEPPA